MQPQGLAPFQPLAQATPGQAASLFVWRSDREPGRPQGKGYADLALTAPAGLAVRQGLCGESILHVVTMSVDNFLNSGHIGRQNSLPIRCRSIHLYGRCCPQLIQQQWQV